MARACRTSAADQTGQACSPPDHPARFKVENVARQVSWLAPAPGTVIRTGLGGRRLPALGAVAVSTHRWCLQLRGQPRLEPRSRLSSGLAGEPRTAKATQWLSGGQPLSRLWGAALLPDGDLRPALALATHERGARQLPFIFIACPLYALTILLYPSHFPFMRYSSNAPLMPPSARRPVFTFRSPPEMSRHLWSCT